MSSIDPLSPPKMAESRDLSLLSERISSIIDNLKQQVAANWCIYVKKRMEENKQNLDVSCKQLLELSQKRRIACEGTSADLLMKRMNNPISIHNGSSTEVKNDVDLIQLSQVKRIPPYTTWIFLNKNQEMPEDQSVVGRRRIYYDQSGEEALICSDSEEEKVDEQEYKKVFNESEDYILRMTIKEAGSSDAVLDALAQCFSRKPFEIKERYEVLAKADNSAEDLGNPLLDKDLNTALDSFDTLFCRRCFVFDCRLHGCSQDLVYPAEKLLTRSSPDEDEENGPCGPHCYKVVSISVGSEEKPLSSDGSKAKLSKLKPLSPPRERRGTPSQSESATSSERNISERNENPVAERVVGFQLKRQKNSETSDSENGADMKLLSNVCNISQVPTPLQKPKSKRGRPRKISLVVDSQKTLELEVGEGTTDEVISGKKVCRDEKLGTEGCGDESMCKVERKDGKHWKTIEKSLYQKGLEIFGRNSCLIARNLMNSMKTCSEVFQYMNCSENRLPSQPGVGENYMLEDNSNAGKNETMGIEVKKKSRHLRRRRRVRRLKYSSKSAGYHLSRKRMSDRKDKPRPQYNPCGCESICGKECPCNVNGTCCEKFCGCPKTCKNRFRGCHCAKSQCQSRQCPCFAADRECDADVCRNCWIKCGDGSLGVPSQKGDNYECMNMKILLGQRQRVLLGPSNVSGWGAFLKNSVAKNEYLGEYTGEVVSQQEADKRGKIYDREDQSFLFNLNDQLVVDAFRKGDKLKFANHSSEPNCSAKVLMVAGDHRVGIFSKEKIRAGEELFYDYCYAADCAPSWAKKPEEPGYKKEETGPSKGRARKLA